MKTRSEVLAGIVTNLDGKRLVYSSTDSKILAFILATISQQMR